MNDYAKYVPDYYDRVMIDMILDESLGKNDLEAKILENWKESGVGENNEGDHERVKEFSVALFPIIEEIRKEYKSEVKEESE